MDSKFLNSLKEIEEEINLEDFEDFEEVDDEGDNGDQNIDVEYKIYPLDKDFISKLPKDINPKEILENDIILYNPQKINNPYTPISGKKLNFNNVCNELIIFQRKDIKRIRSNKNISQQQSFLFKNHKSLKDIIIKRIKNDGQTNKPSHRPKNKIKKNKK